jgi:hypothetical protein
VKPARDFAVRHGPLLASGLLAALPVILSTAHSLAVGWTPVGDDAVIATRSYDVLSNHPPLVGQYSQASAVLGEASYSLGPMLYWLLAAPARLGPAAMTLTMGAINTAASFGAVALARRRGGTALMILTAVVLAMMSTSIVGYLYSDVWNPAAGLLPFTFLIFLAWSIGCGDVRLLPLAAIVASFVVQCHLTFVLPSAGILIVAIAGLASARIRPSRRTLIATAVALLVCWTGPLVYEVAHRPGNVEALVRTAFSGQPTLGFDSGVRAVVRTVGAPPWWLSSPSGEDDRLGDIVRAPSTASIVSAAAALAALAALLATAVRRGRRDVALAAAIALVLCLAIGLVAGGNPTKGLLVLSLGYTLWWGTAAGSWAWLTLATGAVVLFAEDRARRVARPAVVGVVGAIAAAVAIGRLVDAGPGVDLKRPHFRPMRVLAARLENALPAGRSILVTATDLGFADPRYDYEMGSVYVLRRDGRRVVTARTDALGGAYDPLRWPPEYTVRLQREGAAPSARAQVLLRLPRDPGTPAALVVTVEHGH